MKELTLKQHLSGKLKRLPMKAKTLHYLGNDPNEALRGPTVAVVGTRKPTPYGKQITEQLVRELVRAGITVVSGLAFGVDTIAHKTALDEGGATVAVLPSGLENIYPASHANVAKDIQHKGSLISEYAPKHIPKRFDFLDRNRIIAALSDAVIIPEAADRSGSLNTASHARSMGIPVFAIPGQITSALSQGTNKLIKDKEAIIITSAQDILTHLNVSDKQKNNLKGANEQETAILTAISSGEHGETQIIRSTGLTTIEFQKHMTMLEIRGKVQQDDIGGWQLT